MMDNRAKTTTESDNSDHIQKTILMFGFESSPLKPRSRSGECDAKVAKKIIEHNKSNGTHSIIFTLKQTGYWLTSLLGEDLITILDKKKPTANDSTALSWFLEAPNDEWKAILLDAEQLSQRKEEYKKMKTHQRQEKIAKKISFWAKQIENNNIAAYINSNIPHILDDFIAYKICKLKGIPTLCPYRFPIFPGSTSRLLFFEDPLMQETPLNLKNIKRGEKDENLYSLGTRLPKNKDPQKEKLSLKKKTKKYLKNKIRRRTINKFETSTIPKNFIYFPLHFQPEASSRPLGGIWGDQILLIELLASKLPKGLQLLVKEHPLQLEKGEHREKSFYESIDSLSNTTLITHNIDSKTLIQKSKATATLTGTIALEALTYNKKCFIFGTSVLRNAPNAVTPRNGNELSKELNILLKEENTEISETSKNEFFKFVEENSIFGYLDPYTNPLIEDQLTESVNANRVAQVYNHWIDTSFHNNY